MTQSSCHRAKNTGNFHQRHSLRLSFNHNLGSNFKFKVTGSSQIVTSTSASSVLSQDNDWCRCGCTGMIKSSSAPGRGRRSIVGNERALLISARIYCVGTAKAVCSSLLSHTHVADSRVIGITYSWLTYCTVLYCTLGLRLYLFCEGRISVLKR